MSALTTDNKMPGDEPGILFYPCLRILKSSGVFAVAVLVFLTGAAGADLVAADLAPG